MDGYESEIAWSEVNVPRLYFSYYSFPEYILNGKQAIYRLFVIDRNSKIAYYRFNLYKSTAVS